MSKQNDKESVIVICATIAAIVLIFFCALAESYLKDSHKREVELLKLQIEANKTKVVE